MRKTAAGDSLTSIDGVVGHVSRRSGICAICWRPSLGSTYCQEFSGSGRHRSNAYTPWTTTVSAGSQPDRVGSGLQRMPRSSAFTWGCGGWDGWSISDSERQERSNVGETDELEDYKMKDETTERPDSSNAADPLDDGRFAPKQLSARQTIVLTGEILGGIALLMGLLWLAS